MQEEAVSLMGDKETLYARKGKPDPFAPFVQGAEPESAAEGEKEPLGADRNRPKTPLERFSLGQLRLTAVMKMPDRRIAMVEESAGKGYVVKKGTYIGDQGGQITRILEEAIVIEEKYRDAFGNVKVREKKLKLQK
ncbi:MAG: pilus assembly protein PilP [Desulfobacterales bacterium]|nr:pilus assembly protein PilP [Desulfobacterales bacterium]